jgi:hypothetical protein
MTALESRPQKLSANSASLLAHSESFAYKNYAAFSVATKIHELCGLRLRQACQNRRYRSFLLNLRKIGHF